MVGAGHGDGRGRLQPLAVHIQTKFEIITHTTNGNSVRRTSTAASDLKWPDLTSDYRRNAHKIGTDARPDPFREIRAFSAGLAVGEKV